MAVLRSTVPTDKREAWYERQLRAGVEVVICHPRLVEHPVLDLPFPTLYFAAKRDTQLRTRCAKRSPADRGGSVRLVRFE